MSDTKTCDLIVIGAGPAGLTAGIYGARAALKTLVLDQGAAGGQIATTDEVENYPGIPHITGAELGEKMRDHAVQAGAEVEYGYVESIGRSDGGFLVRTDDGDVRCRALVVATGATPRKVGFEGEDAYRGRGVSYCATCDGMFYRGKEVFVIGGGNSAVEEALYLSKIASKVVVLVRRDRFRAPKGVVDRLLARENVEVRYSTSLVSLTGEQFPTDLALRDNATGTVVTEHHDPMSFGVFVFAGMIPVTDLVGDLVETDASGAVVTDDGMATKTPGLFCAGDLRAKRLRQVITAASDGAIAAMSAYAYLDQE